MRKVEPAFAVRHERGTKLITVYSRKTSAVGVYYTLLPSFTYSSNQQAELSTTDSGLVEYILQLLHLQMHCTLHAYQNTHQFSA